MNELAYRVGYRDERASDTAHWDRLAERHELAAVLDPSGSIAKNTLIHNLHVRALKSAGLSRRDHVLDYGCGTGRLIREFSPIVGSITGVDISEGMVESAARHGDARLYDGCSIPFPEGSFDAII